MVPRIRVPRTQRSDGYRPDIDGLRAVAVLAVFGFHLNLPFFSGGFIGVDIFFVISGYLIASIILDDLRRERFSLRRFYARRVRRILPALVAMVAVIAAASCVDLFPADLVTFAQSMLSCAASLSNVFFFQHSSYFEAAAASQPLLHTWSLAVEEQFYLVFPAAVLLVFRRAPGWLAPGMALLWCASFILSCHGVAAAPEASFYLAPSRAWELLSGALLATRAGAAGLAAVGRGWPGRNLMAAAGAAMIVVAILRYNVETPFPGAAALLPCLGAVLVIAAGQSGSTLVGRLLSLRPAVFVGLISYSLYLWHWPVIYLQRETAILGAGWSWYPERLLMIACAFVLATLSWWCVERPFRRGFARTTDTRVLAGGAVTLCGLAAVAGGIIAADGLPGRFSAQAIAYAGYLNAGQQHFRPGTCFIAPPDGFARFDRASCLTPDPNRPNVLLLGDSHAAQLWYGLARLRPDLNVLQATAAGCGPEFKPPGRVFPACTRLMDYMFNDYLPSARLDRLMIAARWSAAHVEGVRRVLVWAQARGLPVTVFGPMVEYDTPLPRLLATASQTGNPGIVQAHLSPPDKRLDQTLASLAAEHGARYVSLSELLCRDGVCANLADDGSPLEFDTDHLTAQGSLSVVRKLIASGDLR